MNVKIFIEKLKELLPYGEYYTSRYPKESIYHHKRAYILVQKNNLLTTGNCILDLVNNYNCEYIRFGDYSFLDEIENMNGVHAFCQSSGTYLGFKELDGKIIEFDRDDNTLIDYCAVNTDGFLKAVLLMSEFYTNKMMGIIDNDSLEAKEAYIKKCGEAAGGTKYEDFYRRAIW